MSVQVAAAILGPLAAIGAAWLGARTASKSKKVDESVEMTKLQMTTWRSLYETEHDAAILCKAELAAIKVNHDAEMAACKVEHDAELARMRVRHEAEMAALESVIADLRRVDG